MLTSVRCNRGCTPIFSDVRSSQTTFTGATEEEEDLLCCFLPEEELETETLTDANCKLLSFDKKPYVVKETEKHMNGGKKKAKNLKKYAYTKIDTHAT